VQRRLVELERQIGRKLVRRHPSGYQLTELGEALRPAAESVEAAVIDFERKIEASETGLTGTIRLTCPEPLVSRIAA
jgi:DNA-binding transcriptional LysR family regulator